jgi:D-glycero-D-manno-heptose 1,7-bisphosphate phosphatase
VADTRLTAVFLDRDGVINRKAPEGRYVTSWDEFAFLPGALEGLAVLARGSVPVIVVTNQRGIARGVMTAAELEDIHRRMRAAVAGAGGRIDAIYHCPHEVGCHCRKPEVGMFEDAAAAFGLTLSRTVVIGDQPSDMEAARRIGALRVLVSGIDPGNGGSGAGAGPGGPDGEEPADHVAPDLLAAARWIDAGGNRSGGMRVVRSVRSEP